MPSRVALCAGLLALALTTAACGENLTAGPAAPTGPGTLSPLFLSEIPAVEGLWGGVLRLDSLAGGTGPAPNAGLIDSCVSSAFSGVVGTASTHTLALTETETGVRGRLASEATGLACTYTGTLGAFTLALDASTCDAPDLILRCQLPDEPERVRILRLAGSSIAATYTRPPREFPAPQPAATAIGGRAAHTYHVLDAEEQPLSSLVATHTFDLTRR